MAITFRRDRSTINIWPGFVDALATLLMVIIFLVMIFAVAQFYLADLLTGRDEPLERLNALVNELAEMLNLERTASADLQESFAQLSGDLQIVLGERDELAADIADLTGRLNLAEAAAAAAQAELEAAFKSIEADKEKIDLQLREIAGLAAARRALEEQLAAAQAESAEAAAAAETARAELAEATQTIDADKETIRMRLREIAALEAARDALKKQIEEMTEEGRLAALALGEERQLSAKALSQLQLLNRQIAQLRQQIAALNQALDAAEVKNTEQQVEITNLGARLNVALASKVQELARYRSEFFGRLREALGDRPDIQIVGDRFILQSEVLFHVGAAELEAGGQAQLRTLAGTVSEIAKVIPPDIDWVLLVEGHTDKRPIKSFRFPSNWELSTARATSVVKFLIENGVPANRLAAAGYGEFQPLDTSDNEIGYRRNRRIELKLTQPRG